MRVVSSPNHDDRPPGTIVDTVVLHYTGMQSGKAALKQMCDPEKKVSAHYMVEEDGRCYQLVPEDKRAWHAGVSYWTGREGLNDFSIGIEIVNPGHEFGYRPFPEKQMRGVETLLADIWRRHPIIRHNVVAHSDIAPMRKEDPGEYFDWARLAAQGLVEWLPVDMDMNWRRIVGPGDSGSVVKKLQEGLRHYGYLITVDGEYDAETAAVVRAFRRRFSQANLCDEWTAEAEDVLQRLLALG